MRQLILLTVTLPTMLSGRTRSRFIASPAPSVCTACSKTETWSTRRIWASEKFVPHFVQRALHPALSCNADPTSLPNQDQ